MMVTNAVHKPQVVINGQLHYSKLRYWRGLYKISCGFSYFTRQFPFFSQFDVIPLT